MVKEELIENAIGWFNSIAEDADKLTTGNLSHNKATLKGRAIRAAEFLEKHKNDDFAIREDLEEAAESCMPECMWRIDDNGDGITENGYDFNQMIEMFKAGAKWRLGQMLEDAIDAEVQSAGCFIPLINAKEYNEKLPNVKFGDKVKVIVFKED